MGEIAFNRLTASRVFMIFGTTAELFKILPVANRIGPESVVLFYTGQQTISGIERLLAGFKTVALFDKALDVAISTPRLLSWVARTPLSLYQAVRKAGLSSGQNVTVAVHGDTVSALVGAVVAKLLRHRLAHIEAGLRSGSFLNPFPEELIRRAISVLSNLNFAPGQGPAKVLAGYRGKTVDTNVNTSLEAIRDVIESAPVHLRVPRQFALVSLHRYELFRKSKQLTNTVRELIQVSERIPVFLVVDSTAAAGFSRTRAFQSLLRPHIHLLPKMPIGEFHYLLRRCSFLITDSGGQQEEAFAFGVPSIIHRKRTERTDGLGWNSVLSNWEAGRLVSFCGEHKIFRKPEFTIVGKTPSEIIVSHL